MDLVCNGIGSDDKNSDDKEHNNKAGSDGDAQDGERNDTDLYNEIDKVGSRIDITRNSMMTQSLTTIAATSMVPKMDTRAALTSAVRLGLVRFATASAFTTRLILETFTMTLALAAN